MVSRRLKMHSSDILYLQKTKPCIRKHIITKADGSLVDGLCECADNILRSLLAPIASVVAPLLSTLFK
jgi:hypothetical protein